MHIAFTSGSRTDDKFAHKEFFVAQTSSLFFIPSSFVKSLQTRIKGFQTFYNVPKQKSVLAVGTLKYKYLYIYIYIYIYIYGVILTDRCWVFCAIETFRIL